MRSFGKIETAFWQSPRTKQLSERARLLMLYVLTCPHGNSIGCFPLPDGYIAADLGWPIDHVPEPVSELVSKRFIERDETSFLTRILGWWSSNTIENANVAKAALKTIAALPPGPVLSEAIQDLRRQDNRFVIALMSEFPNGFRNPEPSLAKPEPEPEPEPESRSHVAVVGDAPARSPSAASEKALLGEAVEAWNVMAAENGLAQVQKLTDARKAALRARLKDLGGMAGWDALLAKITASAFLRGEKGDRAWKADFDFVIRDSKCTKILEGAFDDHPTCSGGSTANRLNRAFDRLMGEPESPI